MLVGYGKVCITPEESVPLAGMGNTSKRMSTMILDDLAFIRAPVKCLVSTVCLLRSIHPPLRAVANLKLLDKSEFAKQ